MTMRKSNTLSIIALGPIEEGAAQKFKQLFSREAALNHEATTWKTATSIERDLTPLRILKQLREDGSSFPQSASWSSASQTSDS